MQAMNSLVYNGQSFLDKVIEQTGDIENTFEMALLNNASITDELVVGSFIKVSTITNKAVVDFYNEYNRPATALSNEQSQEIENIGIGNMIIGTNFIVK
jgi:hypothetical protein